MDKYKIDYSKWDRMEDSDDDENGDDACIPKPHPQVTVFDQPTRVTFGGNADHDGKETATSSVTSCTSDAKSGSDVIHSTKNAATGDEMNSSQADATVIRATSSGETSTKHTVATDKFGIPLSWTENGATAELLSHDKEILTNQTIHLTDPEKEMIPPLQTSPPVDLPLHEMMTRGKYFWSQDRMMTHVRIPITSHQKLKYQVRISNLLSYPDRHCATFTTDSAKQRLVVTSSSMQGDNKNDTVLLEGTLSYPVYVPEDYDEDEVDWSIQTYTVPSSTNNDNIEMSDTNTSATAPFFPADKYLLITLYKATPMMGMTIWWKRCLTSETNDATIIHNHNDTQQKRAFQKIWDDAHEQFQQTIQSKTKYSL